MNPTFVTGKLALTATVSDVVSDTSASPDAHRLMPGFAFSGDQSAAAEDFELYRVYVFTDKDCVNLVYRGAIVGGPAYAPRSSGPLDLPDNAEELLEARDSYLEDGEEGVTKMADESLVQTTESDKPSTEQAKEEAGSGEGSSGDSGSGSGSGDEESSDADADKGGSAEGSQAGAGTSLPMDQAQIGAPVDLWDTDWPTGGYYWTVVPVEPVVEKPTKTSVGTGSAAGATTLVVTKVEGFEAEDTIRIGNDPTADERSIVAIDTVTRTLTLAAAMAFAHTAGDPVVETSGEYEYVDQELPQDACEAGRVHRFGKGSEPTVSSSTTPYASGLSPAGRLISAASQKNPVFHGSPLVAWTPALGADAYEVQWSKQTYPFKSEGVYLTFATSASLPLKPGSWYYRVRGLNLDLVGAAQRMSCDGSGEDRRLRPDLHGARSCHEVRCDRQEHQEDDPARTDQRRGPGLLGRHPEGLGGRRSERRLAAAAGGRRADRRTGLLLEHERRRRRQAWIAVDGAVGHRAQGRGQLPLDRIGDAEQQDREAEGRQRREAQLQAEDGRRAAGVDHAVRDRRRERQLRPDVHDCSDARHEARLALHGRGEQLRARLLARARPTARVGRVHEDLALAFELADVADAITIPRFRALDLAVETKADLTPVTDADRAAEEALRAALAERRPEDGVLGEEGGETAGSSGRRWILDPVDGTKNYSRGIPVWATLIALETDGEVVVGVVSAPALHRRWWASRHGGAFADGQRLRVSAVARVEDAVVSFTRTGLVTSTGTEDLIRRAWHARTFSDFWSHMLVAEGSVDVALEPVMNIWDVAPIQVIVEEAGGRVTDERGGPHVHGGPAVSTNGVLHDGVLAAFPR